MKRFQRIIQGFITIGICLCMFFTTMMTTFAQEPEIISEYAYVIDLQNQEVVYEKNAEERMYPASMTKVMTVLVALEQIENLDEVITLGPDVFEGLEEAQASVANYQIGDEASLRDLLYGIMLPSGADASRAVAFRVAGSEAAFVQLMNEKAQALGLTNTHFVNTTGLHEDEHYSTAKDIGTLVQAAIENTMFYEIFTTDVYITDPTNAYPQGITHYNTRLYSQNELGLPNFIKGSKTGFTLEAGLCLASLIEEEGMRFISITGNAGMNMNGAQHLQDAYTIYTYLQATFAREVKFKTGESVGTMEVERGKSDVIKIAPQSDVSIYKKWMDQSYTIEWEEQENTAPMEVGDVVGKVKLVYADGKSESFQVQANEAVELTVFYFIISKIFSIGGFITILLLCAVSLFGYRSYVIHQRRKRRRERLKKMRQQK